MKTQEKNKNENFFLPASRRGMTTIAKLAPKEDSLGKWLLASLLLHLVCTLLFVLTIFCFKFFNIKLGLFPEQKPPIQDIQFILDKKQIPPPIHKKMPPKVEAKKTSPTKEKVSRPKPQEAPKISPLNKLFGKKQTPTKTKNNGTISKSKSVTKPTSKSTAKHAQNTAIPDFSATMPKLNSISSGLGSSGKRKNHASGFDASNSAINDVDNSSAAGNGSSSHSGFDKTTTKKIITTYDISPYVSELKRNVRWNWKAPKTAKRVELFLRIARDGRLITLNVKRTSEAGDVDNAALGAVKKCVPLDPLPAKYNKNYLDVVLIFDSNSISSRY